MGRLLGDEIAEEANKPVVEDYDVEDVFEHQETDSNDESVSGDEELGKAHYTPVEKSRLRKEVFELDGKYQGTIGSRDSAFGESDAGEKEESDAVSFRTDSEDESVSEDDREHEDEREEEGEAEPGDEENEDAKNSQEEELQRARLAELIQAERKKAASNLSQNTQRDASKGFAILEQSKLFDNVIDVRMKLQKAVAEVNKLPLSKESWKKCESAETSKLLKQTVKLLNKTLAQVTDFRREFQVEEEITDADSSRSNGKHKRNFKELEAECNELDDQLRPYRSAVLHKWSSKIAAASGNAALNNSKFKAINQPANVQVENQLADLPRLLKRTRLSRKGVLPLCFEQDLSSGRLAKAEAQATNDEEEVDIPKNYDPRRKGFDVQDNAYIFDDEDFYRVLLNDLVDKKINNARNQGTGAQIAITTRSNKLKKDVDTKASKGRKLNYAVQEPIANYEAPKTSANQWSDEQIDEFFAGLLGQKVNFDEDRITEEQPEEDEAIKNDNIQIFG
ncbi:related to Protein BFR2 [Zygosaccharomyces bailii ISA1307]|nr:related to Protein BFR2 [Zygosaccharomyces bailii ISA1307]